MIIVSQDKKRISQNLEVGIYPEYNDEFPEPKILCYKIENDYMILGEYKTEERAKEVLEEIIFAYKCSQGKKATIEDIEKLSGKYENTVYEMPED